MSQTQMSLPELLEQLQEIEDCAKQDTIDSSKDDANSYGAGYDAGYWAGIIAAKGLIKDTDFANPGTTAQPASS